MLICEPISSHGCCPQKVNSLSRDPKANLMKECKEFKMDDHAKFTAVCQGKKTEPFDLSMASPLNCVSHVFLLLTCFVVVDTIIGLSKEGGMTTGPCV